MLNGGRKRSVRGADLKIIPDVVVEEGVGERESELEALAPPTKSFAVLRFRTS